MKNILTFCLAIAVLGGIKAQKNTLDGTFGHASLLGAGASGFELGLAYSRYFSPKSALSLDVSYTFAQARGLMAEFDDKDNLIYRDYTNPTPFGTFDLFNWDEDAFPKARFRSKPDRFFAFNIGLHYWRTLWERDRWSLQAAIGATGAYRDEMKMLKVVHINDLHILNFNHGDFYLPVMQYRTYLDAAATAQMRLSWRVGKRLSVGLNNKLLFFPASDHWWLTTTAKVGFDF
jgi:hypothetical protein